jgi:hypothetical protein
MVAIAAELASNVFVYFLAVSDLIGFLLVCELFDDRRAHFQRLVAVLSTPHHFLPTALAAPFRQHPAVNAKRQCSDATASNTK